MRAKQSFFVPTMILLSWGVMRWQTIENAVPSVRAKAEEGDSASIPLTQIESFPALVSQDFVSRLTVKKRSAYSKPSRAQMARLQRVHIATTTTTTYPALSALPQAPTNPVLIHVEPSPVQQTSFLVDAPSALQSAKTRNVSASYWLLWRNRASLADVAANGQIGASQGGIRLRAPIASFQSAFQLSLSARLSQSLKQGEAPEGSIGASLLIGRKVPIELIAERRLKLGQSRDSAWSLTAATGLNEFKLTQLTELDGYVQLGVVGARSRRPFIGGNAIVSRPLFDSARSKARIGLGIWGDAQHGAARLDVGPDLTVKSSLAGTTLRLSGQWRIRVVGEAKPSSGPAVVIGGDF